MKAQLRLGLFGGSFDPVHNGHLRLAHAALKEFHLDSVIFIPARRPPHKLDKTLTSARDRVALLSLALDDDPRFVLSRFELRRRTTTYTYQTIEHFRKRCPKAELFFIIGSDSLAELHTWKQHDRLLASCQFIVGRRTGAPAVTTTAPSVHFARFALPAVSSSGIRAKVAAGRSIRGLVPPAVARYIRQHGLYRS